jgi:type III pantothenate kinase
MDAVFDIGNTNTKVGLIHGGKLTESEVFPTFPVTDFYRYLSTHRFRCCIISTVVQLPDHLLHYLKSKASKFLQVNTEVRLPIDIEYETPGSLGNDRIALVSGAASLYPGKNLIIISAGTCITYNVLTADGIFKGGAISPGLQMRLKAMHEMTNGLPLVEISPDFIPLMAQSTKDSLLSGALNGAVLEIEGYINTLKHTFPDLEVLLCGGDSRYLAVHLNTTVRLENDLAFAGLHKILTLNV